MLALPSSIYIQCNMCINGNVESKIYMETKGSRLFKIILKSSNTGWFTFSYIKNYYKATVVKVE